VVVVGESSAAGGEAGQAAPPEGAGFEAVFVTIPWRRRDPNPASKGVIVVDAGSGQAVQNALATRIENESGDVVFQPNPGSSEYHVYYMPWQSTGGYYPTVTYPTPGDLRAAARYAAGIGPGEVDSPSRAQQASQGSFSWLGLAPDPDPAWEEMARGVANSGFLRATVTHIQSVNNFHSFFPMEVIATPEEEAAFWDAVSASDPTAGNSNDAEAWAVVPEHRDYPIRMKHFLPRHWVDEATASQNHGNTDVSAEPSGLQSGLAERSERVARETAERSEGETRTEGAHLTTFSSQVLRDEAFTFQLGIVSGDGPLEDIRVTFDDFPQAWMEPLTCFNCEGIDEKLTSPSSRPVWPG
jgi:hypothetical protein